MTRITIRLVTQVVRTDTRQHSGLGVLHENVTRSVRVSWDQIVCKALKHYVATVRTDTGINGIAVRLTTGTARTDTCQHSSLGVLCKDITRSIRVARDQTVREALKRHVSSV